MQTTQGTDRRASRSTEFLVAGFAALVLAAGSASAQTSFNAVYQGTLFSGLDWSRDLGIQVGNTTPNTVATGAPLTQSASAVRDGRLIQTEITQVGLYSLGDAWAGSWTGSIDVPGPGGYGLFGRSAVSGLWQFSIDGQTPAQNLETVYHYALRWDVSGPAGIHPTFTSNFAPMPLSGTQTGSFTMGFFGGSLPMNLAFGGATFSGDSNAPGRVEFSYDLAFSTSAIDTSVFTTVTPVPEPETYAMMLAGLALLYGVRRRKGKTA